MFGAFQPLDIVIIEEDSDDRILLSAAFNEVGLGEAVLFFSELTIFLESYNRTTQPLAPSVILLDVVLPGISIQEAIQRIHQQPALSSVPIVVMVASRWEKKYLKSFLEVAGIVPKEDIGRILKRYLSR